MNRTIVRGAVENRNEIRKAEAAIDEALIQSARLGQRMLQGRRNRILPGDTGQLAIVRLNRAQQQSVEGTSELPRVHAEPGLVAREPAIGDEDCSIVPQPSGVDQIATRDIAKA